jgi:putative FmdB family regulatory protein
MGVPTTKSLPLEPFVGSSSGSTSPDLAEMDSCGIDALHQLRVQVYQLAKAKTTETLHQTATSNWRHLAREPFPSADASQTTHATSIRVRDRRVERSGLPWRLREESCSVGRLPALRPTHRLSLVAHPGRAHFDPGRPYAYNGLKGYCEEVELPLYEYVCTQCGHRSEKIRRFSDPPLTKCDKCGGKLKQLVSSPAIQFKGSGWYVTDYARKPSTATADSAASSGDGSKEKAPESAKKEVLPAKTSKEKPAAEKSY